MGTTLLEDFFGYEHVATRSILRVFEIGLCVPLYIPLGLIAAGVGLRPSASVCFLHSSVRGVLLTIWSVDVVVEFSLRAVQNQTGYIYTEKSAYVRMEGAE